MTMTRPAPLWRSMLYVPATADRFVAKAADRGADAVILDLEDSIPPSEKQAAREALPRAIATVGGKGTDVIVRINRPWRLAVADMEVAVVAGVDALCLPKVDSADHIAAVDEVVEELEQERGLPLGQMRYAVLIETAKGIENAREIAKASPRIEAMTAGGEDLSADLGMPEADQDELAVFDAMVRLAAREAGVIPLGYRASIAEFTDLDLFRKGAMEGRKIGTEGGMAIHPAQVPILNEAFSPTTAEIEHAEGLLQTFDEALAKGLGVVNYKGKMIDKPIVDRARRVLAIRDRLIG